MKDTKNYILKKSLELFLQKSFKEVTMREIVEKTGLSKGAFYHYFASKEAVFEEVVRYFYNDVMITDYKGFPETSLKDFYQTYLQRLQYQDKDIDYKNTERNIFVFISDAAKRIPSFANIHNEQRKKELNAWSNAVKRAKKNNEINCVIPDTQIAKMFIYISDGLTLTTITHAPDERTITDLKACWDNLYQLLTI